MHCYSKILQTDFQYKIRFKCNVILKYFQVYLIQNPFQYTLNNTVIFNLF